MSDLARLCFSSDGKLFDDVLMSSANDRVDHDSALLSSVDNHYRIKDTKSKKRLDPKELPVSDFLLFNEDYSGDLFALGADPSGSSVSCRCLGPVLFWASPVQVHKVALTSLILSRFRLVGMNFGQLLMHLRPPKITPEQFMDLKYRVEQLGKQPVRETSSNQILSLLEKYHVVVPKEVLESLLNTGIPKGGRRKTVRCESVERDFHLQKSHVLHQRMLQCPLICPPPRQ
jgi:hypothetical protein